MILCLKGGVFMYRSNKLKSICERYFHLSLINLIVICIIGMCIVVSVNSHAQEPTLAEKVFEKYETLLLREDIFALLPVVLEEIKKPEKQELLTPESILLVVDNPDILKTFVPDIDDKFITLLKEDQEVQAMLRDSDFQLLLQDVVAIDELATLIAQSQPSLAIRVFEKYKEFFQREDIQKQLPDVLAALKNPEIQELLNPESIQLVVDKPDILKSLLPDIDDGFITLLKEDVEVIAFINDPDVQLILQNPAAIDELAALLGVEQPIQVIVKIVPASIESPLIGEQLVITVDIADGKDVYGYQGVLEFDPTALEYVSLTHGTYLAGNVFPIPTEVENNQITFALTTTDSSSTTSDGTLVTITFEVIDSKASSLTLNDVIISGFAGVEYPVTIENGKVLDPPQQPWDVNNDRKVNILDLTFVASYFGAENAPPAADVNGDGKVNILDLTLVASHFGEVY